MNSPNRSTSESVGGMARLMAVPDRASSQKVRIQPMATPAHTTKRGSAGRKALPRTTPAATTMPIR